MDNLRGKTMAGVKLLFCSSDRGEKLAKRLLFLNVLCVTEFAYANIIIFFTVGE